MLLFNGSLHNQTNSFNREIYNHVYDQCSKTQLPITQMDISEMEIPHFDPAARTAPEEVENMLEMFINEDKQIWLTPLYHGGIPGIMKNALDWLQLTSKDDAPYLTNKKVGLICIADGLFAIQGINVMTAIAHNLRAWVLPYTLPINKSEAKMRNPDHLASYYRQKIELMIHLMEHTDPK